MYLLTNEQRKCFALSPVQPDWTLTALPPSKYDSYRTYVYITADDRVVKLILQGEKLYEERDVDETLSPDHVFLLPKTAKGKPVKFTATTITKRTRIGMSLSFCDKYIYLYSNTSDCDFYPSFYAGVTPNGISDFFAWIENWCAETGEKELADIEAFASAPKRHIQYQEGDFFRFRLDRHHFGYGRILINYDALRKKKIPFWDVFMGKPILAGIYHIVTEGEPVSIEQLDKLKMLPPQMIMDNVFFYGECEIIGNLPVDESKYDLPIHYGQSISAGEKSVMYQCGRTFLSRDDVTPLFDGFINNGIGFFFDVSLPILTECIKKSSNLPYWEQDLYRVRVDLRNPQHEKKLKEIRAQFGLPT